MVVPPSGGHDRRRGNGHDGVPAEKRLSDAAYGIVRRRPGQAGQQHVTVMVGQQVRQRCLVQYFHEGIKGLRQGAPQLAHVGQDAARPFGVGRFTADKPHVVLGLAHDIANTDIFWCMGQNQATTPATPRVNQPQPRQPVDDLDQMVFRYVIRIGDLVNGDAPVCMESHV